MKESFIFTPHKLMATRKEFNERYKDLDQGKKGEAQDSASADQRFAELIMELKGKDRAQLPFFTRWLTQKDLLLLAHRFSSIADQKIKLNVIEIFYIRDAEIVIRPLFSSFLENYHDQLLKKCINVFLDKKQPDFPPPIWTQFLAAEVCEVSIGSYFAAQKQKITETLHDLMISGNTLLAREGKYVAYSSAKAGFFSVQDTSVLEEDLSLFTMERLKKIAENYLLVMGKRQRQEEIMKFFLKKLGAPGQTASNWAGIAEKAREKFKEWFYTSQLELFFSSDELNGKERFEFWRRYLGSIKHLRINKLELILLMDFGGMVAVEFGKTGNAAYLYRKKDFASSFGTLDQAIYLRNDRLKNIDLVIERIIHNGEWQPRAARLIRTVLAEGE